AVADELGLKQMGPQAKIDMLHLPGLDISNIFCFTTFDFSHFNSLGTPIHGIIGSTLLERYRVTFDFEAQRITLSDETGSLDKPENAALLPFENHKVNNAPLIEFEINGKPYKGMIDTGQPHSVVLPIETFKEYGSEDFSGALESRGLMEKWPNPKILFNTMARLKTVQVGPWAYADVLCLFGDLPQMLSMPLIGTDFLSQFKIIIDFPNDEMVLIPRAGFRLKDNLFSVGLNVGISEAGEVIVEGLWEESPSDKAGLDVGDRIVSFNNEPVRPDNLMKLQYALRDDRIRTIELEIFRGDTRRRVVLEKANLF
ncbi:MAG: PDZ domain-containing protein, partial [Candidatus Aminicenantes bacterium]|nr:PDZ domain-containing protein [Candidatus Aminicenantes bacterium]